MPWFHHWSSDNGKWHIFSFTTKFQKINGVLTVVGETVYVPTNPEHYDNPEHHSNHHVPFDEKAVQKLPKHVRERAEELWNQLNERFVKTSFRVSAKVEYDHQRIMPGELVERVEEWRKAPEGHYIAKFKTKSGESIPLMMDEVVPAEPGEEEKIELETLDDLFAFLRKLPEQERWEALKVIDRLQKRKIDHVQAAEEIKSLFLKSGVAHE